MLTRINFMDHPLDQNKTLEKDLLELVKQDKPEEIRKLILEAKKNKKFFEWNFMNENYFKIAVRETLLSGNIKMMEMFLSEEVDSDGFAPAKTGGGYLPFIHFAAASGKKEMVELLIKNDAKIYSKFDNHKDNTLYGMLAALEGRYVDILDYLLAKGANACGEFYGIECEPYLGYAAKLKDRRMVESLIRHGAMEAIPRSLRYAIKNYVIQGIKEDERLLCYQYNNKTRKKLVDDCERAESEALRTYYKTNLIRFDETKQKLQEKITADKSTYHDIVSTLLDYAIGVDLPSIQFENLDVLRYLKTAAKVNFIGVSIAGRPITREILTKANVAGADEAILTLDDLAKIDDPIRRSALYERVESVIKERGLLIKDNIINLVPLWAAARDGDLEAVMARLNAGVDPNEIGMDLYYGKTTPLFHAIRNGHEKIVDELFKKQPLNLKVLDEAIGTAKTNQAELFKKLSAKKTSIYTATSKIQFWYRRTRDENKALELLDDRTSSPLAQSILSRR